MVDWPEDDVKFMKRALALAREAASAGEAPIGAVVVAEGRIVGEGRNEREELRDATAHAEMLAIQRASQVLARWRLSGATIYVTIEPCPMCAGAIYQARIDRLVYGAPDPKAGASGSLYEITSDGRLNHQVTVQRGLFEEESAEVLRAFFRARRGSRGEYP